MRTFDTPHPITVSLELGIADVRVIASARADTVVDIQPGDPSRQADMTAAADTRVELTNGTLMIRSLKAWRRWTLGAGRESVDVRIEVPSGSTINGSAGVGVLRCIGELGACRYHTGVGDIFVERASSVDLKAGVGDVTVDVAEGRATIKTAGAIRAGSIGGPATIRSSTGDTWIGEARDEARVSAANGEIVIDRAQAGVVAKAAHGDVRIACVEHGPVVAQSHFGTIDVDISGSSPVWLDAVTRFGRIHNDLEVAEGPVVGDDSIAVRAQTSMGDITVRRSAGITPGGGTDA